MDLSSKKLELLDWLMHINDMDLLTQIDKLRQQLTTPPKGTTANQRDFVNYLREWPEMTEEEMKAIEEKRKHFRYR